ncbi:ApeA N-terminal domain 1-containing protein [Flavitalea sp.]|nr:HEPN domain-containing protein [Flavitalea sp.]
MLQKKEYTGSWKLSGTELWYAGILRHDPYSETILALIGDESVKFDHAVQHLIVGKTMTGFLTLYGCWLNNSRTNFDVKTIDFSVEIFFVGAQYQAEADIVFNKIYFGVHNLASWVKLYSPNFPTIKGNDLDLQQQLPNNVDFEVPDNFVGKIEYGYSSETSNYPVRTVIENHVTMVLESKDKKSFGDWLKLADIFADFITFCTFSQSDILEITFIDHDLVAKSSCYGDIKWPEPVRCYYTRTARKTGLKNINPHECAVLYQDIQTHFRQIIRDWYQEYYTLVVPLYLGLRYFEEMHIISIEKFMDVAKALEVLHRKTEMVPKSEKDRVKILKKKVYDNPALTEFELQWLKEKLSSAHEPTLRDRLIHLITNFDCVFLKTLIPDVIAFSKRIADLRNLHTHYDDHDGRYQDADGPELRELTDKMIIVLLTVLLRRLDIDSSVYARNLKKKFWRLFPRT